MTVTSRKSPDKTRRTYAWPCFSYMPLCSSRGWRKDGYTWIGRRDALNRQHPLIELPLTGVRGLCQRALGGHGLRHTYVWLDKLLLSEWRMVVLMETIAESGGHEWRSYVSTRSSVGMEIKQAGAYSARPNKYTCVDTGRLKQYTKYRMTRWWYPPLYNTHLSQHILIGGVEGICQLLAVQFPCIVEWWVANTQTTKKLRSVYLMSKSNRQSDGPCVDFNVF